jgi:hypothetical protein
VDVVLGRAEHDSVRPLPDVPINASSLPYFLELLPFPVNLFHPDGTSLFVNSALVGMFKTAGGGGFSAHPRADRWPLQCADRPDSH